MKASNLLLPTLREIPADAEIISHQLMLRAGMIRQLTAGIYTWLPLGLRILRKVEAIVREEMNRSDAQEVLMSGVQPAELWQESGRWDEYGPELLRLTDRHGREFCLGPTHEEIITDLIRREIHSYKQLPVNFYQIQTKFRDEIRPRFGIMRAREFLMKDAYSFHLTQDSLQETYQLMHRTYCAIFSRLGLDYRVVLADSGNIGGAISHEFHVLADTGEDEIVFSRNSDYAANMELAESSRPDGKRTEPSQTMQIVDTPGQHSIEEVARFLGVAPSLCLKTLIVNGTGKNGELVALILRGDHTLNAFKAEKLEQVAAPLRMADEHTVRERLHCDFGSIGPVGLDIPVIADYDAANVADFVCGANKNGKHLTGVNWQGDIPDPATADIRNVRTGEMAPDGSGPLDTARGIEVGHIFQLGEKYSAAMKAACLNEKGQAQTLIMGCYGIGISRIVAAAIEQHHDERGIIWPQEMAPFQLSLIPINMHRSRRLQDVVMAFYEKLKAEKIDVLLDDRRERPGVMFADAELIGIPHRLVLNEKHLDTNNIEYKGRRDADNQIIAFDGAIDFLLAKLRG